MALISDVACYPMSSMSHVAHVRTTLLRCIDTVVQRALKQHQQICDPFMCATVPHQPSLAFETVHRLPNLIAHELNRTAFPCAVNVLEFHNL
eukprot:IDg19944t1